MDVIAFFRNGAFTGDESMSLASVACSDIVSSSVSALGSLLDGHVIDSIIRLELPITLNHLFNILAFVGKMAVFLCEKNL